MIFSTTPTPRKIIAQNNVINLIKNKSLIFCFKCKTKTNTNGISEKISKNGRNMICGICELCGTKN